MRPQTAQNQVEPKKRRKAHEPIDWASYDRALKRRGNITFWFSDEAIEAWHPPRGGSRGGQRVYSGLAIETVLSVRLVFKQALRQAEGFVESILGLMGLDLKTPDHTTLSRRAKGLEVAPLERRPGESLTVVVDSSGLKVYGQGEWDAKKHGRKNRRRWCKLNLCINEANLDILSHSLTTEEVGDSTEVPKLLDEIEDPIDELLGDGAYDGQPVYDRVEGHGSGGDGRVTVPPRSNATLSLMADSNPTKRDGHVRFIDQHGRQAWECHVGYGRRLVVENAMFRYKTIIGRHMRARSHLAQKTEAALGCKILNRMSKFGLPQARLAT